MSSLANSCFSNIPRFQIDFFDKCSQPEYAGINMICMPHSDSNISDSAIFGAVNSQFSSFLSLL
jgi:hypothetical protein